MRIKSYFAQSVQEAMEKARLELGPEAMLMSSSRTGPDSSRLGAYEVVFGLSAEISRAAEDARPASGPSSGENSEVLARELAELRKKIENVQRSVSRQGYSRASGMQRSAEFGELYEMLAAADFSDEIAQELVEAVAARAPGPSQELARKSNNDERALALERLCGLLREEINERVRVSPELGLPGFEQRIVAFVGGCGAGKTTSLVKLALKYGVAMRTPIQILSTDTLRVGGSEHLGAYASIMGVGFQAVPTMAALEQALEDCRTKNLILIDTPGYAPAGMEEAEEFKGFLSRNPHIEVQLVVPATLRPTTVSAVLARFAIFHPSKLLLTHVDETAAPGALLDLAIRSGLPVSFLATGQQIPEDIEAASKTALADKLFERTRAAASFAA